MSGQRAWESWRMPMRSTAEFGGGDIGNKYCVKCTDESGRLKSYDEVLASMSDFVIRTMGVSAQEAYKMAKENMAKMPAWSG